MSQLSRSLNEENNEEAQDQNESDERKSSCAGTISGYAWQWEVAPHLLEGI
jgi:hypothetical protein